MSHFKNLTYIYYILNIFIITAIYYVHYQMKKLLKELDAEITNSINLEIENNEDLVLPIEEQAEKIAKKSNNIVENPVIIPDIFDNNIGGTPPNPPAPFISPETTQLLITCGFYLALAVASLITVNYIIKVINITSIEPKPKTGYFTDRFHPKLQDISEIDTLIRDSVVVPEDLEPFSPLFNTAQKVIESNVLEEIALRRDLGTKMDYALNRENVQLLSNLLTDNCPYCTDLMISVIVNAPPEVTRIMLENPNVYF